MATVEPNILMDSDGRAEWRLDQSGVTLDVLGIKDASWVFEIKKKDGSSLGGSYPNLGVAVDSLEKELESALSALRSFSETYRPIYIKDDIVDGWLISRTGAEEGVGIVVPWRIQQQGKAATVAFVENELSKMAIDQGFVDSGFTQNF
jgi:hypothetical protein